MNFVMFKSPSLLISFDKVRFIIYFLCGPFSPTICQDNVLIPLQAMVNVDHKFDYLKGGHICYPLLTHRESHFLDLKESLEII